MAKYSVPLNTARVLDDLFSVLREERDVRDGKLAIINRGKYAGYRARCHGVVLHEKYKEGVEFIYWFDVFRKDGKGFLANDDGEIRRGRSKDEFTWI